MRKYGDGQKGFFDMQPGKTFTVNMGYRVYDNESSTRSRYYRDYEGVKFKLLKTSWKAEKVVEEEPEGSLALSLAGMMAAITLLTF